MTLLTDETRFHTGPNGNRYRIQFYADDYRDSPWENEDGMTPCIWKAGRDGGKDWSQGCDLFNPWAFMSDRTIRDNRFRILDLIDGEGVPDSYNPWGQYRADLDSYCDEWARDCDTTRADARRETLGEIDLREIDRDDLAALWNIAGVPAACLSSSGYSQGDYAEILFVAHPDALKAWGFSQYRVADRVRAWKAAHVSEDRPTGFEGDRDTWGAWCWGGVVSYVVEYLPDGEDDDARGLEHVDSCGGFYPEGTADYFPLETAHAYALSQAIDAANHDDTERGASLALNLEHDRPDMYA